MSYVEYKSQTCAREGGYHNFERENIMSTKAQTKANRQNAQKSTGPQTDQGKKVVSQNAVKHGLFAAEAVIKGEDPAEYQAYHDQFLAELDPVGAVETMLADRFVSLVWRLKRAERMQNQAIDSMIESQIDNPMAKSLNMVKWHAKGVKLGDSRYVISHLQLGRIASSDWCNCRVLDRMMLYERRIENSMIKMMNELKKHEIMRRIEYQDAEQQYEPSPSLRDEAATQSDQAIPIPINDNRDEAATRCPAEKKGYLKKQSQFAPELMGTTPIVKGDYENKTACGAEENKAKQSQFPAPEQTKGAGKSEKSLAAATG